MDLNTALLNIKKLSKNLQERKSYALERTKKKLFLFY